MHAQAITNELTAHSLVLLSEGGKKYARIDMGTNGGEIKLYDAGKPIWKAAF